MSASKCTFLFRDLNHRGAVVNTVPTRSDTAKARGLWTLRSGGASIEAATGNCFYRGSVMRSVWTGNIQFFGRYASASALTLVALCGALLINGCSEQEAEQVAASHAWLNVPQTIDDKAVTLPPFLIHRVAESVLAEALSELESESYVQISPAVASHYAQREVRVPMEMRPFLIRAIKAGDGEITVIQTLTGLWAKTHAAPGTNLEFGPLVVFVDPTPTEIFVTVE